MEKNKAEKQRANLLKVLNELGLEWNENVPFDELKGIISKYIISKSKNEISDFAIIPGGIGPAHNYQIYVKKK